MRGNVVALAVGVIIGAAFGKIVSSFVGDLLMPPIGLFLGKTEFSNLLIGAFAVLVPIKHVNRLFPPAAPAVTTRPCPLCLLNIPFKASRCANCTSEVKPA